MKQYLITSKGFTLIETLFAILIFSAALISLLSISSKGISATNQVKNETAAHYLAQEGLEVTRTIRDANFMAISGGATGVVWTDGFATVTDCTATLGCYVAYSGTTAPVLALNTSSGLTSEIFLSTNGQYANFGTVTGFSRTINVSPGTGADEFVVTSEVTWKAKTINRSIKLQTILKKWQ